MTLLVPLLGIGSALFHSGPASLAPHGHKQLPVPTLELPRAGELGEKGVTVGHPAPLRAPQRQQAWPGAHGPSGPAHRRRPAPAWPLEARPGLCSALQQRRQTGKPQEEAAERGWGGDRNSREVQKETRRRGGEKKKPRNGIRTEMAGGMHNDFFHSGKTKFRSVFYSE